MNIYDIIISIDLEKRKKNDCTTLYNIVILKVCRNKIL